MTQGNRSTQRIQTLFWYFKVTLTREDLGSKRFIEFDQIKILDAPPLALT